MITGLKLANELGIAHLLVKGDSKLVIEQVKGDCDTKGEKLKIYQEKAARLAQMFQEIHFQHIPRSENDHGDRLSRLSHTSETDWPQGVHVEIRTQPDLEEGETCSLEEEPEDWRMPIKSYLGSGVLPADKIEAKRIQARSLRYVLWDDEMYRLSFSGPLLQCVAASDIDRVLEEVHEGGCGSHIGSRALALKINRAGYYWPSLLKDAVNFV